MGKHLSEKQSPKSPFIKGNFQKTYLSQLYERDGKGDFEANVQIIRRIFQFSSKEKLGSVSGCGSFSLTSKIAAVVAVALIYLIFSASSFGLAVINEVLYDPPGKDEGCFVELMGTPGLNLDDYFLVGVNGNGGKQYNLIDLSGHAISLNGYFVIAQDESVPEADLIDDKADFQNGPDSVELWIGENRIDSVGYGDFSEAVFAGEVEPTLDLSGYSIGRRPDGADTNNNSVDFVGLALTSPGAPNGPGAAVVKKRRLIFTWGRMKRGTEK